MNISDAGLDFIKQHESLRLQAYVCPAGVLTIGYGHTKGVRKGDVLADEEEALELLREDVAYFETCVDTHVNVPMTQSQFDALVSFAFNVGCGAFAGSTLLKRLNAGDPRASDELLRWTKGGGVELAGLVKRREEEREMFNA